MRQTRKYYNSKMEPLIDIVEAAGQTTGFSKGNGDTLKLGGMAEVASELRIQHLTGIETNEMGTPLVSDLFARAAGAASGDTLCYVNADIILTSEFCDSLADVVALGGQFLVIGRRWDLDVTEPLDFASTDWEQQLREQVKLRARLHSYTGIDYFIYTKGLFGDIPPFAVGRTAWDNWLVAAGLERADHVIDATQRVLAVHQNHHYGASRGRRHVWGGDEAAVNRTLAAGRFATIANARHVLMGSAVRRTADPRAMIRQPARWLFRLRTSRPMRIVEERLLRLSRPIRDRLRRVEPVGEVPKST